MGQEPFSLDCVRMIGLFHALCLILVLRIPFARVSAIADDEIIALAENGEWFPFPHDKSGRMVKIVNTTRIGSGNISYEKAKAFCKSEGSRLITIHSPADLASLAEVACMLPMKYFLLTTNKLYLYTGLEVVTTRELKWHDGTPVDSSLRKEAVHELRTEAPRCYRVIVDQYESTETGFLDCGTIPRDTFHYIACEKRSSAFSGIN